jgi:hypothetical protein
MEEDSEALERAAERLSSLTNVELLHENFLGKSNQPQISLFQHMSGNEKRLTADVIITNPPYVRTQVLGAAVSKQLARDYSLRGREDLYHAFVRQLTEVLRPGGTLGLLCSNRFMFTLAGAALRELLGGEYQLHRIYDLGDTKLFPTAAVLPAIVVAEKHNDETTKQNQGCPVSKVYETESTVNQADNFPSVLRALEGEVDGVISVSNKRFAISTGSLLPTRDGEPWRYRWRGDDWLSVIEANSAGRFEDFAKIRVGIKTTADSVFVRNDWNSLPADMRPEAELLHPLFTHHNAEKWRPNTLSTKKVLYPHTRSQDGRRAVIDLSRFPKASMYFNAHRRRLEGREYVTSAGRAWYEIWVPQDPSEWSHTKIVFPDISETPKFFLDGSGAIVNGDCYWFTVDTAQEDGLGYLMLAVANSSLAIKFYDAVCGNKLYANRRRFITQYVNRFPVPKRSRATEQIVKLVRMLLASHKPGKLIENEIDPLVWESFGLTRKSS